MNDTRSLHLLLLSTLLALASSVPAHADVLLEKRLIRRFETNWCPFFNQINLHFTATTQEALLTFQYEGPNDWPAQIDNIAIVPEEIFTGLGGLSDKYANFRSGGYTLGWDFECYGEPFFQIGQVSEVPFKEIFEDSFLPEWILSNASWKSGASAPIVHSDPGNCCSSFYHGRSLDTGALQLDGPESSANAKLSGLKIGSKYFVTGWIHGGPGEVTITVDAQNILSQAAASFTPSGGEGTIFVNLPNGGAWTVTSHSDWIMINEVNNNQNGGSVAYTVAANSGDRRTGTLIIGGKVFTVFQGASFLDVPLSHPFYEQIGKLSARGVTAGCLPNYFCPDNQVSHEQMAAFVIRALGEPNPPIPLQQTFSDVPPSLFGFPFIEEMASRKINAGCSLGLYCPNSAVTRENMAFIVIKALGIFSPPDPSEQRFLDVPPSRASYAFVEEMANRGITSGCAADLYCPDSPVTRGQMAVFLARAFDL